MWHVWRVNIRKEHLKVEGQKRSPWDSSFGLRGAVWLSGVSNGHLWTGSLCFHQQQFDCTKSPTKHFDFNYLTLILKCNQTKKKTIKASLVRFRFSGTHLKDVHAGVIAHTDASTQRSLLLTRGDPSGGDVYLCIFLCVIGYSTFLLQSTPRPWATFALIHQPDELCPFNVALLTFNIWRQRVQLLMETVSENKL